jgi:flagellar hook protein FlgE
MSLFTTLGTGASGLTASSTSLSVIGDNIANVGTTGFKSSRAYFADMFPGLVGSAAGAQRIGRGAMLGGIGTRFNQGAFESTGGVLDLAIGGGGFFAVRGADGSPLYSRDGAFQLDRDGRVVNLMGASVQGYEATDGVLSSKLGDLVLDLEPIPAVATSVVTLSATLASEGVSLVDDYSGLALDGTGTPLSDVAAAADFSTSTTVYDSLGVGHEVMVNFERTAAGAWSWSAVVDGAEVDLDGDGAPDGDGAFEIASGTVSFDGTGQPVAFTEANTATAWSWGNAEAFAFRLDVGLDAAGNPTEGSLVESGSSSFVDTFSQDGHPRAGLVDLAVSEDGQVRGVYENGQQRVLGAVAIATFSAEQGLERVGGNLFRATFESGEPALGVAGQGGRGAVASRVLERSTTDLEAEFIAMIQAQRSFQASAGVVRTADETLQELVNLV